MATILGTLGQSTSNTDGLHAVPQYSILVLGWVHVLCVLGMYTFDLRACMYVFRCT